MKDPDKKVLFDTDVRSKILTGVETLTKAVRTTLGPKGRNVLIDRGDDQPAITKDGITVAKSISLPDRESELGVRLLREASARTGEQAGDGTTTATVVAESIYKKGLQQLSSGAAPVALKRGIDKVVPLVVDKLNEMKLPADEDDQIRQVGTIAANGEDKVGDILLQAFKKVGRDGVILIEEGIRESIELELIEGLQFDRGFVSPWFCNETSEALYEDVLVLISEKKINSGRDLVKILTEGQKANKPILIIADDYSQEALNTLVVNRLRSSFPIVAVKAPGFGDRKQDLMEDIAAVTGATIISDSLGTHLGDKFKTEYFGKVKKIIVKKEESILIGGAGDLDKVEERAQVVRDEIEELSGEPTLAHQKEFLEVRLAKLAGGIARVAVGGATEAEMLERKDRIEDALYATRAAIEEGILPGGGVALLRAAAAVDLDSLGLSGDELLGAKIVLEALESPVRQIAQNAGGSADLVVERVLEDGKFSFGYNAATGVFEDLLTAGVIDPVKVVRSALENAASAAGTLLTTECMVVELPQESEQQ